ncbi:hypothetical protein [Streptomyces massasporeus]
MVIGISSVSRGASQEAYSVASGRPGGPEQCVALADALRAYTSTAA